MIDIDKVDAALQRAANSESKTGQMLILVRVVAPHFVAGFETDGIVRRAAPIFGKRFVGLRDDQARQIIERFGWKASVIPDPQIIQHEESFEVRRPSGRKFFYFDDNAGRRAVSGRMTSEQAFAAAQAWLNGGQP